jgi:hypothetical protein
MGYPSDLTEKQWERISFLRVKIEGGICVNTANETW